MTDYVRITPVHEKRQAMMVTDLERLNADAEYRHHQVMVGVALELLRRRIEQVAPRYARIKGSERLRQFVLDIADAAMPGADRATVEQKLERHGRTTERLAPNNPVEVLPDGTLLVPPDATTQQIMQAVGYRNSTQPPRKRGRPHKNSQAG